jgi:hypothetical protein
MRNLITVEPPRKKSPIGAIIIIILILLVIPAIITTLVYILYITSDEKLEAPSPISSCGDRVCNGTENSTSCPRDCTYVLISKCGDRVCNGTENNSNCPKDCTSSPINLCGNNICNTGENYTNCPRDCNRTTTGGSSGGSGSKDTCTPSRTCSYYYNKNECGSPLSNGCENSLSCTSCGSGKTCSNGHCIESCINAAGCNSAGVFCSGSMPYNCSVASNGCLIRTNLTVCSQNYACINQTGCIQTKDCTSNDNCTYLNGTCGKGFCNTTSWKCQANYNSTDDICRPAQGDCDSAERCSGSGLNCLGDSFVPVGTVCRASKGSCDLQEACLGNSASCPTDSFIPTGTLCRASQKDCDAADYCLGSASCIDNNKSDGADCSNGKCHNGKCVSEINCGNNIKELGEACDGIDVGIENCEIQGNYIGEIYNSGNLKCLTDCSGFNLSECKWSSPYDAWENGPSSDPNFFPISVWAQRVSYATKYKDIGVNMIYSVASDLTESNLDILEKAGVPGIWVQNDIGISSGKKSAIGGWRGSHEPDNAQWNETRQAYDPCLDPLAVQQLYNSIKSKDSTRPVFVIFDPAVGYENWWGRGTECFGKMGMYPEYIKGADAISFDIYPYAQCSGPYKDRPDFVAKGVERLVKWANGEKIVWNFIETGNIDNCSDAETRIDAYGLRTEVWMSIIHGSQGISYFVHEWWPSFKEDAIFRHPEIVNEVNKTNRQIRELAPVLNSRTIENAAEVSSGSIIKFMVKNYNYSLYLFAVEMVNKSSIAEFYVYGVNNGKAEVLGENREITIVSGKFQDNFLGYEVHLYKISSLKYYKDSDSDGFGRSEAVQNYPSTPKGYSLNNLDCNDSNKNIYPSAKEIYGNDIDEDCNGHDNTLSEDLYAEVSYFWRLDGNADDEKGNNGLIVGDAQFVSGKQGQALKIDGDGDYVNVPFSRVRDVASETLSTWVYRTGSSAGNSGGILTILGGDNTNHQASISASKSEDTVACSGIYDSGYSLSSPSVPLATGEWTHITCIFDYNPDEMNISIYKDGVYEGSKADIIHYYQYSSDSIKIGSQKIDWAKNYFNGSIDNAMIFERALNEEEIQALYCSQGGQAEFCQSSTEHAAPSLSFISRIASFFKKVFGIN